LKDFDDVRRGRALQTFEGPYRNPEDLPRSSRRGLRLDHRFLRGGQNSTWLLPNRLYEGCRHGAVPIALAGTETAHFLEDRKIGLVLPELMAPAFRSCSKAWMKRANRARLRGPWPNNILLSWSVRRDDCEAFVRRLATLSTNTDGAATVAVTRSPTYRESRRTIMTAEQLKPVRCLIAIPCLNEAGHIEAVIANLHKALADLDARIIVRRRRHAQTEPVRSSKGSERENPKVTLLTNPENPECGGQSRGRDLRILIATI